MVQWYCKKFDELNVRELYAIMKLRNAVFVVEQNCVYQDADDKDLPSWHYMGWLNEKLVAYTRLLPPGLAFDEPSIGRVVTHPNNRKSGLGRELMIRSVEEAEKLFGKIPIRIGAQVYLRDFYTRLGFQSCSDVYLEDNIEHIEMIRVSSL